MSVESGWFGERRKARKKTRRVDLNSNKTQSSSLKIWDFSTFFMSHHIAAAEAGDTFQNPQINSLGDSRDEIQKKPKKKAGRIKTD